MANNKIIITRPNAFTPKEESTESVKLTPTVKQVLDICKDTTKHEMSVIMFEALSLYIEKYNSIHKEKIPVTIN